MTAAVDGEPPAKPASEDDWILARTRGVIDAYLQTREMADFARSVKSMTDHTVHEYGGRFLLELLQNGYDAHGPDQTDGRIAVVLRNDEGEHGTVYVANTGAAFNESNVRAISNLGLSDKPVGEGIGNKGVGFKSVLQVSAAPEIYSRSTTGNGRGYRFRFATPADVRELVPDPLSATDVLENVSLLNLIVPLRTTPPHVSSLWNDGYVTVVRLPLRSEIARSEAHDRLNDLRESQVPVMLFLGRLQSIALQEHGPDGPPDLALTRHGVELAAAPSCATAHLVTLNDGTEYYVFARDVDAELLRQAVSDAVADERLDRRWLRWQAPASVSVAVPLGGDATIGRCYTYLPLGSKAPAPFAGHLNAPFFTNLARLDLDYTNPLNTMLLRAAAGLCLDAAEALRGSSDDAAALAALDLLSWDAEMLPHLEAAAADGGVALRERSLIPTLSGQWVAMTVARRWPISDADVLTAQLAHDECGLELLRDGLGDAREGRLVTTLTALDMHLDPSGHELADAVETMMRQCLHSNLTLTRWELAYDDIAAIFADHVEVLAGRRILLTEDMTLGQCASRGSDEEAARPVPFFPPVRQRVDDEDEVDAGADLSLPKALRRRLFYLHPGLRWYDDRRQQTRARKFLQDHRLVRRFDTRSILEHIATVVRTSRSRVVHIEALRFTYNATTATRTAHVAPSELGLRVLSLEGEMVPASEALFSADWALTNGADLSTLATTPADVSAELAALRHRLLAPPDRLLRSGDDRNAWIAFLRKLGVSELLPVHAVSDTTLRNGSRLTRRYLADVPNLPEPVRDQWRPHLREHSTARYPETPYRARSAIYWLPGQAEYEHLSNKVRDAYTRLVIAGMKTWPAEHFTVTWERDRPGEKDPEEFPTPVQAFVTTAEWLRIHLPRNGEEFATAFISWHYPIRGDELPPRFSPLMSKALRDLIDDDSRVLSRLAAAGVGQWTARADAARLLRHLGDLLASNSVDDVHLLQFERTYRQAWDTLGARTGSEIYPEQDDCYLVVDIAGRLTAVNVAHISAWPSGQRILVADSSDDRSLLRVLSEFGQPLLQLDHNAEAIAGILSQRLGEHIAPVKETELTVIVDGQPFHAEAEAPTLLSELPWLRLVVATVAAYPRGAFTHLGERAFHDTADALSRVRLVRCAQLAIKVSQQIRELPTQLNGILPVADDEHPTLALRGHDVLTWASIEALSEPLARLLRRPQLAADLALTVLKLQSAGVTVGDGPTHTDIAAACNLSEQEVANTARRLDTALTPVLERLQPIIMHYCGITVARQFDPDGDEIRSDEELLAALTNLVEDLPEPPSALLSRARNTASHDELRRALGIPLPAHNAALGALGARYQRIDFTEQYAEDFAFYVSSRWQDLSQRIRRARLSKFIAHDVGDDWLHLRHRSCITPDPAWGTTIDVLDDATMAARVESELHRFLGEEPAPTRSALEPLDDLRRANTQLIDKLAEPMTLAVRAWLLRNGRPVESPWDHPSDAAARLRAKLDEAGAFDFLPLKTEDVISWLHSLGTWPDAMPSSFALDELRLTAADVDAQRSEAERERLAIQRARRLLEIDGAEYDTASGLMPLRDALKASLAAAPAFTAGPQRFALLAEVARSASRGQRGDGSSGGGLHREQLSEPQRHAIGFAGEWLVYEWLKSAFGDVVTEECWKSSYRAVEFPGDPGDDGLGYDFLVPARRGDLMFEVKATRGAAGELELGESEVRTAQAHARNRRWRLIVVEHALTTERRRLILPNPFSPSSRGRYVFVGRGLRLRFDPE